MIQHKNSSHILSIDVNSHLKKLAANFFTSPSHYIVELVRGALYRGASHINVDIKKGFVRIADNGEGINPHLIESLNDLMDPVQSMDTREQCIEDLKLVNGIGLVAIFSASPTQIKIENYHDQKGISIFIVGEKLKRIPATNLKSGTTISIKRNLGNFKDDIQYLLKYCVFCQSQIFLNGKKIPTKKTFPNMLVSLEFHNKEKEWIGCIGIPKTGDTCGIFFLDHGILWNRKILPPENGFIYFAATEWCEQSTDTLNERLIQAAQSLYRHLAKKYLSYPIPVRDRIDEIFFKHHFITSDNSVIDQWTPFQILGSKNYFSYPQILEKSKISTLYAIPSEENPSSFPTEGRTVLLLDNQKTDFLVNHKKLLLTFLSPLKKKTRFSRLSKIFPRLFNKIKCLVGIVCFSKKVINVNLLTSKEVHLLSSLNEFLNQHNNYLAEKLAPDCLIESHLYSAKYFMYFVRKKKNSIKLYINRNHPRIHRILKLMQEDSRNIEMISSLFTFR